jgi:hypothetical protein
MFACDRRHPHRRRVNGERRLGAPWAPGWRAPVQRPISYEE